MVSSFNKLQKAQNKCIRFCLNLSSRSPIDPSHFGKFNWLVVSDRVDYCIANTVFKYWNEILPGYIHEMFKPSLCRYNTKSQMALDIKVIFGFGSKIGRSIKNVRTSSSFMLAIKKIVYFICKANLSYHHILVIDIII